MAGLLLHYVSNGPFLKWGAENCDQTAQIVNLSADNLCSLDGTPHSQIRRREIDITDSRGSAAWSMYKAQLYWCKNLISIAGRDLMIRA